LPLDFRGSRINDVGMTFSRMLLLTSVLIATPALAQTTQPTSPVAVKLLEAPAAMSSPGVPPIPMELVNRVRDYTEFRGASPMSWHPKQRQMLIRTRFGNVSQGHLLGGPMMMREQLTFFPEGIGGAGFARHDDSYMLIVADVGGSEFNQLYRFDLATRQVTLLSDGKSRNSGGSFSNANDQIVFTSTRRNGRDNDFYRMDPKDPASSKLLAEVEGGGWGVADWSPDDSKILVARGISVTSSELYLMNAVDGTMKKIAPKEGERISYDGGAFLPDGLHILTSSDRDSEFSRLVKLNTETGVEEVFAGPFQGDVEGFTLTLDGSVVAISVNEMGRSRIRVFEVATQKEIALPELPVGQISLSGFRPGTRELALTVNSSRAPGEVYSLDLVTGQLHQWTKAEGAVNTASFVEEELVKWKSFDGLEITGWLSRPDPKKFPGKRPIIINIHGGPEGQARPGFQGRSNYYLNELGVAILYPNVRGSTGFGKTFVELDNGFKREDSVKDIGALLDWVAQDAGLDASRVMVTGGSYGGYMTLAVATLYPDRIRCASSSVGISNFVTFLTNTQAYRRDLRRVEYGDERDPKMREFLESISPLNRADRIVVPMMIVQGANDPRVPVGESEQIVNSLRSRGHDVWYLLAADEGHGFAKKENSDFQFYATVLFIKKHLLGG
jgi:dipeptidyl aminopeptidase/acylaminoacyl peptidase